MQRFAGSRIKALRQAADIPKEQLALAAGRSFQSIELYESGRVTPRSDTLGKIATALGCSVDAFYEDELDLLEVS